MRWLIIPALVIASTRCALAQTLTPAATAQPPVRTTGVRVPGVAEHWVATWGTAQQQLRGRGGALAAVPIVPAVPAVAGAPPTPPAAAPGRGPGAVQPGGPRRRFGIPPTIDAFSNQTVRMIARSSIGGRRVRVRLANALGGASVRIAGAHIAIRRKDSAIVPGTDRILTFSGAPAAMLYAGQVLVSDPVALDVPPLGDLAESLYLPQDSVAPTSHRFGLHTTYVSKRGDFTTAPAIDDPATTSESYYWLAGIDVLAPADAAAVVNFGDSITDGDQSTPNSNGMWPALLAVRLQRATATAGVAVVNAGIAGNRLLGDDNSGLARLLRDALSVPGVKWLTLLEGINDITNARPTAGMAPFSANDLIAGYRQVIETAHLYGVEVIGCTITPFGGSNVYSEEREAIRQAANQWIRTSGAFDAVIDFDAATRDPADTTRFRAAVDSPDMLHPGDAGYRLMAESIDLSLFSMRGAIRSGRAAGQRR